MFILYNIIKPQTEQFVCNSNMVYSKYLLVYVFPNTNFFCLKLNTCCTNLQIHFILHTNF